MDTTRFNKFKKNFFYGSMRNIYYSINSNNSEKFGIIRKKIPFYKNPYVHST